MEDRMGAPAGQPAHPGTEAINAAPGVGRVGLAAQYAVSEGTIRNLRREPKANGS